jgi:D-tagatose-1,6-bisphosphate aldolase subunit GatZ/KbaZ
MKSVRELLDKIIYYRQNGMAEITLLAVCPNSSAVLEAAVKAAAQNRAPMLFAATLNQVDRDGGYTGWTPAQFVAQMQAFATKYVCHGSLYPCLDHGGPWLKDLHTLKKLTFDETMVEVRDSITACLEAGYRLLHIDPTVDRTLPTDQPVPVETIVDRTVELISYAETERERLGLPRVDYEVGTEEVHGGLANLDHFKTFLNRLRTGLEMRGLQHAWPCFVVAQVGTDLHTTSFDLDIAHKLYEITVSLGSLIKGHYTDWVKNPTDYPVSGMGGANVGPELTAEEYLALRDLSAKEQELLHTRSNLKLSNFMITLEQAVVDSGRWIKWLQPGEEGLGFENLSTERRDWLGQTGARYVWSSHEVLEARQRLYENLSLAISNPHEYVVDRIVRVIDKYINAFHLFETLARFEQ